MKLSHAARASGVKEMDVMKKKTIPPVEGLEEEKESIQVETLDEVIVTECPMNGGSISERPESGEIGVKRDTAVVNGQDSTQKRKAVVEVASVRHTKALEADISKEEKEKRIEQMFRVEDPDTSTESMYVFDMEMMEDKNPRGAIRPEDKILMASDEDLGSLPMPILQDGMMIWPTSKNFSDYQIKVCKCPATSTCNARETDKWDECSTSHMLTTAMLWHLNGAVKDFKWSPSVAYAWTMEKLRGTYRTLHNTMVKSQEEQQGRKKEEKKKSIFDMKITKKERIEERGRRYSARLKRMKDTSDKMRETQDGLKEEREQMMEQAGHQASDTQIEEYSYEEEEMAVGSGETDDPIYISSDNEEGHPLVF